MEEKIQELESKMVVLVHRLKTTPPGEQKNQYDKELKEKSALYKDLTGNYFKVNNKQ